MRKREREGDPAADIATPNVAKFAPWYGSSPLIGGHEVADQRGSAIPRREANQSQKRKRKV